MDIAYIETQFHVLGDGWKSYLLVSVALFFFLAIGLIIDWFCRLRYQRLPPGLALPCRRISCFI